MKKITFLFLLIGHAVYSQFGLSDQYQFNLLAVNPAFAGERGNLGVTAMLGNQFSGNFKPNLVSQIVSLEGKLGTSNSSLGFQGFRNTITGNTSNGLNLSYAYSIKAEAVRINLGVNGGFIVTNLIGSQNFTQQLSPIFGIGISAITDDAFLSISAPTLVSESYSVVYKPINLMAGYRLAVAENIAFNLSALAGLDIKYENTNYFHINPKLWLADKLGIGASFRMRQNTKMSIITTTELKISESSTVGISYDPNPLRLLNTSGLVNPNGLFQLMFRYDVVGVHEKTPLLNSF